MDTKQLRMAIRLSETLHFGKAAEAENIVQSGLSSQIAKLETELGFRIFDRCNNRVSLTLAGQKFITHSISSLSRMSAIVDECRQLSRTGNNVLRIGFVNDGTHEKIYSIVSSFRVLYPNVTLNFIESGITSQIQSLISGQVDLSIIRLPANDERLDFEYICEEPRVVAVPALHKLAESDSLSCNELESLPFVVAANGAPSEWLSFWSARQNSNSKPNICAEVNSINESLAAVAYSGAFDTFPLSASKLYNLPGIRFVTLKDESVSVLALATLKNNPSPMVTAFRNIIKSHS